MWRQRLAATEPAVTAARIDWFRHRHHCEETMNSTNYPYIRAWSRLMGSHAFYVSAQVERAQREGAPQDAIYRATDGWRTIRDVKDPVTLANVERLKAEMEGES